MASKRAKVVYFAGLPKHDPVSPLDMNELHYKELSILGAYGATHRQYRITMDYLDRRQDDLARVVTHRFPLDKIAEAFETIRSGTGLKMVILPERTVRDRLRCGEPGDERRPLRRRRHARRVGVRAVRPVLPAAGVGRAGPRRVVDRGRTGVPQARSSSVPAARRRSPASPSDRSSTAWWPVMRRVARCAPRRSGWIGGRKPRRRRSPSASLRRPSTAPSVRTSIRPTPCSRPSGSATRSPLHGRRRRI